MFIWVGKKVQTGFRPGIDVVYGSNLIINLRMEKDETEGNRRALKIGRLEHDPGFAPDTGAVQVTVRPDDNRRG